jgi:hypothetical protein
MEQFPISIVRFLGKSGTTLMLVGLLLARFVAHGQQLISPDHNLALTFSLTSQGGPMYALTYKGKTVLGPVSEYGQQSTVSGSKYLLCRSEL